GDGAGGVVGAVTAGLTPWAVRIGELVASTVGAGGDLRARLRRIHSPMDPTAFRLRQLAYAGVFVAAGIGVLAILRPPPVTALAVVPGAAVGGFVVTELQLDRECRRWDRRRVLELPVVAEQLAMLLGAGYSVGAALDRVASRANGACSADVGVVCRRVGQGLSEAGALAEWSEAAANPAVDRLVAVLRLSRETSDLGRLLAEEARAIRRQVLRQSVELMDRRSQQVWVPVTVAALIPGCALLAVPFLQALHVFTGG
ncbi:MAG TPA: type II secretion system F family protein, partial [Acidimicrobiales bacterium]|nr:type II secretion system F family protein [Acidimicrobiales bacterium]